MESFHWGQYFETGFSQVDDQHHHLVDLINQFGNLLTKEAVQIEDVDHLYKELADYAVYHFQNEEQMMLENKMDIRHLNAHIEIHNRFLDDVTSLYASISSDNLDQAGSFLKFLTNWLAYHTLGQDQNMAKQLRAIQSGVDPSEAYDTLERERSDETEPLLDALNGLFVQVTNQNKDLKKLNESLEEKVALRTQELSELNQHLEELSLTDVLTELPNRRHAMRNLSRLWEDSLQKDTPLVCMMIDVDHFKQVNDVFGHDAGDVVLIELAKTLQDSFRNDDIVCRLGGDEFFVICPDTDEKDGILIAETVCKKVSELRVVSKDKTLWHGSISIGVGASTPNLYSYEELMKLSDKGVYKAKEDGKNCVRTAH